MTTTQVTDVRLTAVELTQDELVLARHALTAFMSNFGHDERDVLHRVRDLLRKVPEPRAATR
jgi:hypothetical protein